MAFRGGGRGRGGFGGASNMPPMGLSFADLQTLSREPTALYPEMDPMPTLNTIADEEKLSCKHQDELTYRLRHSKYYIVEATKKTELPRFSDKYRPSVAAQPKLDAADLNKEFFPPEIWEMYFNPKMTKKEKARKRKKKLGIDDLGINEDDEKKDGEDEDEDGKKDDDEEDLGEYEDEEDDDYNENYFETGSGDEEDDVGAGAEEGGGGGGDYD